VLLTVALCALHLPAVHVLRQLMRVLVRVLVHLPVFVLRVALPGVAFTASMVFFLCHNTLRPLFSFPIFLFPVLLFIICGSARIFDKIIKQPPLFRPPWELQ
jgi:hypothetical protein